MRRHRNGSAVLTAVLVCLAAVACDGVFSPVEDTVSSNSVAADPPRLSQLDGYDEVLLVRPDTARLRSAADPPNPAAPLPGLLMAHGWVAEPGEGVPAGVRLQVEVTTDEGDLEVLELESPVCGEECGSFDLGLRDRSHAYELMPRLRDIPARFMRARIDDDPRARVWVFADDVGAAIRTARSWPDVRYARWSDAFAVAEITSVGKPVPPDFSGALPIDLGSPVPGDGSVQVQVGTTITMQYTQPDGSPMRSELTVH